MRRVFVVNSGIHDMSAAEQYGQLEPLTEGYIDPARLDRIVAEIRNKLRTSSAEDYILLSGPGIIQVAAAAYMLLRHGIVNTIRWIQGKYVTKTIRAEWLKNGG